MPFNWEKDFVEPTARVIEKIRGRQMPKGVHVEKRRTAWERVLHDEDSTWEKVKRVFSKDKST